MKIKIVDNASGIYAGSIAAGHGYLNEEFYAVFVCLNGETMDVETDHLFRDQYNTGGFDDKEIPRLVEKLYAPELRYNREYLAKILPSIEHVLKFGMRVQGRYVAEVIDDARPGKMRCQYCGATRDVADTCPVCRKSEYLQVL